MITARKQDRAAVGAYGLLGGYGNDSGSRSPACHPRPAPPGSNPPRRSAGVVKHHVQPTVREDTSCDDCQR
jgi:hypothetical protein